MKSLRFKEPWVKAYVERLLGLSTATKKAIISALERSMETSPKRGRNLSRRFWSAYGAWEEGGTAEELARSIHDAR